MPKAEPGTAKALSNAMKVKKNKIKIVSKHN